MGASTSLESLETQKVCCGETLKTATWSSFGLPSKQCCESSEDRCEMKRKLKELCTTDEHCMTYSTAGASTCDEGLVVCSCGTPRTQDGSTGFTFSTRQERTRHSIADSMMDSKCLEVETFSTVKRNLAEHGLPLLLRTAELGNTFDEYFVCIHKGGEHFSLLDRKVSRDKNNFHYAWEDVQKFHFVEYNQQEDVPEVAAERKELKHSGYHTSEVMRCTFSQSCCPQQIDLMFRSKEALQCVVDIFQSKMRTENQQIHQVRSSSMTGSNATTLSCPGLTSETNWTPFPSSPEHEVMWVPSPESTPQAVHVSSPLPVVEWPTYPTPTPENVLPPPERESDSDRPADWAAMSERSLNSFYAV